MTGKLAATGAERIAESLKTSSSGPALRDDGSYLVAEALRRAGVEVVFALTSSADIGGILQWSQRLGVRVIGCRDERTAAFMAGAYGALTRSPGVCLTTMGPGLSNAITGLLQAQEGGWPVVSISGTSPDSGARRGLLQEIDQIALTRPVSKWAERAPTPGRLVEFVERALQAALRPPRGHAHLSIPVDVITKASVANDGLSFRAPETYLGWALPAPDSAAVEEAAVRIARAERPVLVVGPGAWFADAGGELDALLSRVPIPTFTLDEARGLVSDGHPACVGPILFRLNGAASLLAEADLVVAVGVAADWRVEHLAPPLFSADAELIQIDSRVDRLGDNVAFTLGIWADERKTLAALATALPAAHAGFPGWLERLQLARRVWCDEIGGGAASEDGLHPAQVAKAVGRCVAESDANLTFDGGNIGKWGKALIPCTRPGQSNRLKGTLASLGHGLPSAMVRRLTDPTRPSVLITGDGSFGYGVLDLETAVVERLPIVAVVAVDGAWGSVRTKLKAMYGSDFSSVLPATRFDRIAEAVGAHGVWVETEDELDAALEAAVARDAPTVVAVRTATVSSPATYPSTSAYGTQAS